MKHRIAGRKLGRTSAHRLALMRNLSMALIDHERIHTTLMKAKEVRRFAERLVTLAKRETLHSRRRVLRHIPNRKLVAKLFDTLSARYAERPGGYTRILKLGPRRGDMAEMAILELVGAEPQPAEPKKGQAAAAETPRKAKPAAKAPEGESKPARKRAVKAAAGETKASTTTAKPKGRAKSATKGGTKAAKRGGGGSGRSKD
jgi:large subunit ribosomal protein L17